MNKFWIVMRNKSQTVVSKRHISLESATAEAERLCKRENDGFIVLEAVAVAKPKPVDVEVVWSTLCEVEAGNMLVEYTEAEEVA